MWEPKKAGIVLIKYKRPSFEESRYILTLGFSDAVARACRVPVTAHPVIIYPRARLMSRVHPEKRYDT